MKIYTIFCDYDIGQDEFAFTTKEKAIEWAKEAIELVGDIEEDFDELVKDGLIYFEEKELI